MASLADVVKRRRKEGSTRTGSLLGAVGEKTLEAIDPRRMFDQSGILTSLFPSLKAYQAKGTSDKSMDKLATLQASGDAATKVSLETMIVKLDSIETFNRVSAKNSLVLPSMARDTYLIKQNIIKMTKALGQKPQESAGDWFNRQMAREAAFEEKFGKARPKEGGGTVQQVKEDKTGFVATLIGALVSPFKAISSIMQKGFEGILEALSLKKLFDSLGLLRLFGILTSGPMLAALAVVGGAAWMIQKIFEPGGLLEKLFNMLDIMPKPRGDMTPEQELKEQGKGPQSSVNAYAKIWKDRFERGDQVSPEEAETIKKQFKIEVPEANIKKPGAPTPAPAPVSTAPTKESFDLLKYRDLVGKMESGGNYSNDNKVGFLGKYQFGAAALEDYGYMKKGSGKDKMAVYDPKNWTGKDGIKSAEDFKNSPQVQDNLFNAYTSHNFARLLTRNIIKEGMSAEDIASRLYAAHHGGIGGATNLFEKGKDTKDFAFPDSSVGKSAANMKVSYSATAPSTGQAVSSASTALENIKSQVSSTIPSAPQTVVMPNVKSPNFQGTQWSASNLSAWDNLMIETIILNKH